MVSEQQKKENWEFLFIDANIDSIETAKEYGINSDYAFNYIADDIGTRNVYKSVSKKVSATRKCAKKAVSSNKCLRKISIDFKKRKKMNGFK